MTPEQIEVQLDTVLAAYTPGTAEHKAVDSLQSLLMRVLLQTAPPSEVKEYLAAHTGNPGLLSSLKDTVQLFIELAEIVNESVKNRVAQ